MSKFFLPLDMDHVSFCVSFFGNTTQVFGLTNSHRSQFIQNPELFILAVFSASLEISSPPVHDT